MANQTYRVYVDQLQCTPCKQYNKDKK